MSTVPPCRTPGPISSAAAEMTKSFRHKPSRVEIICMSGTESTVGSKEVTTSRSQTTNEPAPECGIEPCPHSPTSSQDSSCEGITAACFSDPPLSLAAAPRGRNRAPSSPRGRPSSPLRPGASSSTSPSIRSSVSPGRRRESPAPSSPRVGDHPVESEVDEALATPLFYSPPPLDLPRACYYGMAGLSDDAIDDGPRPGALWKGESSNISLLHTAVNIAMSYSKEPLARAERDTSPRVSSSSSSSSSSAILEKENTTTATTTITNNNNTSPAAAAAAADAAAAAAAAAAAEKAAVRKKARRVTWSPMVLAREDAAAYITTHVKRYFEAEEAEFRAAYTEAVTRKLDQRRAEERAERKRGGAPAAATCRPAAKRGAFFGLLASLYKPEWMGYRMWPQDPFYASAQLLLAGNVLPAACRGGISAPPGRPKNLGDAVKGMAAAMQSRRGQCRA